MKNIRIVFLTSLTKEQIQDKPSNFAYYVKNMLSDKRLDVRLLNLRNVVTQKGIRGVWQLVNAINNEKPDIVYLTGLMGLNHLVICHALKILRCKIFT